MSSLILLLLFIGAISADFKPEQEFEVKQGSLLNLGRSYESVINFLFLSVFIIFHIFRITEVGKNAAKSNANRYTIKNELLSLGKKLVLLEDGQPLYEFKHKLGHLYQK
jgi:large-conductance mechanosensitive channel